MSAPRPLPRLDDNNRDFWTGGAVNELRIMHCDDCANFVHPPRPVCRYCLSENVNPKVVAGTGVIDSYTANYQKWHPDMEVPFIIARVRLDDVPGVVLTTNIIDCSIEDVDIDRRVKVVFEPHDDVYLPMFKLID